MFSLKKRSLDDDLGELEYTSGYWSQERELNESKYWIYVPGSRRGPDALAIKEAKPLVDELSHFVDVGRQFLKSSNVAETVVDLADLNFESVYLRRAYGQFDIGFGEQCGDWEIVVHFKGSTPYDLSCNH